MKKKWIIIGIISVALVTGGYFLLRKKTPTYQTTEVTRRDVVQTVSATGELKSDMEIDLNFETTGRIKEIKTFVNQSVAQGDYLAAIEDKVLSSEVDAAKAALNKARAQAGITNDETDRLAKQVNDADDFLKDTKKYEDQKVEAAKKNVDDAQDYYDDTKDYYDQVVADYGAASREAKSAKMTLTTAENSLNSAKKSQETTEKAQELAVTQAENSLKTAENNLEKSKSSFQENYDDATVAAAQAQYDIALANLEKAALKAPVNGKVTKVNYKKGEIIANGMSTSFGKMISSDLLIEADIAESDIAKVKVNDNAILTYDALTDDEKFKVTVLSVDPDATIIQDVVYYVVKFKLEDTLDSRLKSGMTANIDIETNRKNKVLAIPERLVKEENNQKYVNVLDATNQQQRRDVKLGMRGDEGLVEVINGLKEGEKVIQ